MQRYLIKNTSIVNEGQITAGDVLIKEERITKIAPQIDFQGKITEIDGEGKVLRPGVIDDHVHFREPGWTHKAQISTESKAAGAGGTTSFMEMPNTKLPAITEELLEHKYAIASTDSIANYSFFMGVSNDNAEEVLKMNKRKQHICGVKIYMGSSTGNMLVDDRQTLENIFGKSELLIATHCETEHIIKENLIKFRAEKGDEGLRPSDHPLIRNVEACFTSSKATVELAKKFQSRIHIVHVTTGKELSLFNNDIPLKDKKITAEACVHHLWFSADDYSQYGNRIKCNPAIKSSDNRDALWRGLLDNRLDVIATDNAPHTAEEKQQPYYKAPSGIPLIQHSLLMMLEQHKKGRISLEEITEKMCHAPAVCFHIKDRGYIREGYYADLVMADLNAETKVTKAHLYYKCGWSPFEWHTFPARVEKTFVNGSMVYDKGHFDDANKGMRLRFERD